MKTIAKNSSLIKYKNHSIVLLSHDDYTAVRNDDFARTIEIIMKRSNNNSTNDVYKTFKQKVICILRREGASEEFIVANVTDNAIKDAILNNFTAESLAWAILQ